MCVSTSRRTSATRATMAAYKYPREIEIVGSLPRTATGKVLRRELVNVGYLTRSAGIYRLAERVPERDVRWAHEFPEWERLWLPAYLAGAGVNPG